MRAKSYLGRVAGCGPPTVGPARRRGASSDWRLEARCSSGTSRSLRPHKASSAARRGRSGGRQRRARVHLRVALHVCRRVVGPNVLAQRRRRGGVHGLSVHRADWLLWLRLRRGELDRISVRERDGADFEPRTMVHGGVHHRRWRCGSGLPELQLAPSGERAAEACGCAGMGV